MSSHRLSLSSATFQPGCMPSHASFAPSCDTLAVLWESGHVELWNLQTRFDPKGGKSMAPLKRWAGRIHDDFARESRQVALWSTDATGCVLSIVALGSDHQGSDILTVVDLRDMVIQTATVKMPERNGRLVTCDKVVVWQAPDGELFDGAFNPT